MAVKGIDVSKYQKTVDFKKVKEAGYSFVILNAGYGRYISQKDPYFEQNYKAAKAAGLDVGAYWYSYALDKTQASEEAKVFLEAIKGKTFEYPICMDIEESSQSKLSKAVIEDMINAFCSYCEKAGYYVCIYSYADFLTNKVSSECLKKYDVWVAHFGVSKPSFEGSYGIWQYTSSAGVPGVSTKCDCNYAYKNYSSLIKSKGLNGFVKQNQEKVLDSKGWKKGETDRGILAMKQMFIIARSAGLITANADNNSGFGEGTEKCVNQFLKRWGYAENSIAGDNFVKLLGKEILNLIK